MKLVKNQKHSLILMKIFIFLGESKIHAGLCPFHHRKWHVFVGFGVEYMNFFDVLYPWAANRFSMRPIVTHRDHLAVLHPCSLI